MHDAGPHTRASVRPAPGAPPPSVAYIAVGSNIDPEMHIARALAALEPRAQITGVSPFYRTPALDRPDQPPYLNGVVRVETYIAPLALKTAVLREIEEREGRVRGTDAYAPRTIDLDLVLYDDLVLCTAHLQLPDPEVRERPFVAGPLAELAPDLALPDSGQAIGELARDLGSADMEPQPDFTNALVEQLMRQDAMERAE